MKTSNLLDDIKFIFDEYDRLSSMSSAQRHELSVFDYVCNLPHPSGRVSVMCGVKAQERIDSLALEAARRSGLSNRVSLHTLRGTTSKLLSDYFWKWGRVIREDQVDKLLNSVGKWVKKSCADRTHLLPCTLMSYQEPEALEIGPVKFHNRASFRRFYLENSDKEYQSTLEEWQIKRFRTLRLDAVRFFKQFDWVAEVTVANCDLQTSKQIAEQTVASALDCMHLMLGPENSDQMRIGGVNSRVQKRSELWFDAGEGLQASNNVSWQGQVSLSKGWSKALHDDGYSLLWALAAFALECAVNPDLARPLSRRFLDSAFWFGEAVRAEQPTIKLINYVNALERIIMTEQKTDIKRLMSDRIVALSKNRAQHNDADVLRKDFNEVYNIRSDLLHGTLSPMDKSVHCFVTKAAILARETIMSALVAFGESGLETEKISTNQLANWFGEIVQLNTE